MPISIKDKTNCTGCGGCANVCPKDCIRMVSDDSGFVYPLVDNELCINCNLCIKVCPFSNQIADGLKSISPLVYASWSKNSETRYTSTSGGVFSELAFSVLNTGGKVVGAAYNTSNLVEHIMIDSRDAVETIRQSKYIQSDIKMIYREIKAELEGGTKVLFCGAPCQIAALKRYLRKEYENLYTVDFICRGMNSPKAYLYWLKELEDKFSGKVTRVWFKYKIYGWKNSPRCTRIDFSNGKSFVADSEHNSFMKGYLEGNLYLRPSCGNCQFKGAQRESDITLADFWKIPEKLDDNKGTSMLMINSDKGNELFHAISGEITAHSRSYEEISQGNGCFNSSVIINEKSEEFLSNLGSKPFSVMINNYIKTPKKTLLKRKCKAILKRIKCVCGKTGSR